MSLKLVQRAEVVKGIKNLIYGIFFDGCKNVMELFRSGYAPDPPPCLIEDQKNYIVQEPRQLFMQTKSDMQIGHGTLHVITSEENTTRSEGRTIWLDSKLLWFKIANLDENETTIEKQELIFEGEHAPNTARNLSDSLKYLIERTYINQIQMGGTDFMIVRQDNGNILIKNGSASIEVNQDDIVKLIDRLDYVEAIGNVGLRRRRA